MSRQTSAVAGLLAAGCLLLVAAPLHAAQRAPISPSPLPAAHRTVLETYCFGCHNQKLRTAGLALDTLNPEDVAGDAATWERVIRRLRLETMPPAGRPRPDQGTYRAFASWLESALDKSAAANPNPGRTATFHRLNRFEYQNAVRDLLQVDVDVSALLPSDNTYDQGFDNNAEQLSVSPALLDRYLGAARKISRLAVGIPPATPQIDSYKVHLNVMQNDRSSEDLPFGSLGGIAINHYFPVDGEYRVKIKLQANYNDYIRGMGRAHDLDVRLDGALVKRFTVGGEAKGMAAPGGYAGNIMMEREWEDYMHHADDGLEVSFQAKAGPRLVGVAFVRKFFNNEGVLHPRQTSYALAVDQRYYGNASVQQVTVGGPYRVDGPGDTPSRRRIFTCQPPSSESSAGSRDQSREQSCARTILSRLARRAYRRPITESDVQVLLGFYQAGRNKGSFDDGVQFALERLLIDPNFLLRIERDPSGVAAGAVYPVPDLELATRLSMFLWGSIPDDELLDLAVRGKLAQPSVMEQQVRRLLADTRSKRALVDDFAMQWLQLRRLVGLLPDPDVFPEFDENLREAFQRETELFLDSTLREDRSILELLSARYTFVNERLARHYGIPNVYGNHFRRVSLGSDETRGGLLGLGSILTSTSYPNRTSPVLRGKWLLSTIVGADPPAPPPNVPALPERGDGGKRVSVRERLEQHRKSPVCAACHAPMDPLGFALENFDAIGTWQTVGEGGTRIDASAEMPNGARFDGPAGLRALLWSRRDQFAATVTEKLLAYALGRGLEHYDQPAVRKILRDAAPGDYRWSSIIQGIVNSAPFRLRTKGLESPAN